ncbi:MAG: hypothetical protein LC117_01350 [Bacteroidia bacterium]|nr:hypothetical protein [Bacteroidia bacterium]MCZ2276564.1 hypothetical protein [Bacteroidia bacterium]
MRNFHVTLLLLNAACTLLQAQPFSNSRIKFISVKPDTLIIDTLSIIPGSILVSGTDSTAYSFNSVTSMLIWNKASAAFNSIREDSVKISYQVFPLSFSKVYFNRSRLTIEKSLSGMYNPEEYRKVTQGGLMTRMEGLSKTGSISRGVSFGNNQDVVVNSTLNLQLAGKISEDMEILAAITDNNIPIQPQGNTQQLNDFDKVFIRLSKLKNQLTAGDYELKRPDSYFMNFYKKAQGGQFTTEFKTGKTEGQQQQMKVGIAAAISKGRYARNVFNGTEGNQGPYKLQGAQNESFIVVLSGTEKIYVDGLLLQRGQEYDYIIDYNTAEVTFTSKVLITKDKRIIAEFEYSDKNYARSLFFFNDEWHTEKFNLKLNIYSEQDSKNQPLLQDLSDSQKQFLANLGDSVSQAFTLAADTVPFNINEVLYEKIDSSGFEFFRYSTDSTVARFRLSFTNVGQGNGNYIQVRSDANGRVFEWVAAINGVKQGNFEPVRLLITPRTQQMITVGADYAFDKTGSIKIEGALSNYDVNTFSKIDKRNDSGLALSIAANKTFELKSNQHWKINARLKGEHAGKNFVPIENYRPVEFIRDWNLTGIQIPEDENAVIASAGIENDKHKLDYSLHTFRKGSAFNGIMHNGILLTQLKFLRLSADGSYLTTSGNQSKSVFYRSNADLSSLFFSHLRIGIKQNLENNRLYFPSTDSLTSASFSNQRYSVYLLNGDTSQWQYTANYSIRYDDGLKNNFFTQAMKADDVTGSIGWTPTTRSKIMLLTQYRRLKIKQPELTSQKDDRSLLSRLEYNSNLLNGALSINTFFEAGSGQEQKREYTYVKVADGTGVFAWNDYNGDGIPQLNEFETAAFKDQADYIRVFTPTNEYVRTKFNQLGFVTGLNPAAKSKRKTKSGKIISSFSDQFSLKIENKNTIEDLIQGINPFENNIADTSLISSSSSIRNTIFYNRTSTVFGTDLTIDNNTGKMLLTNGMESRKFIRMISNTRLNFSRTYGLQQIVEAGEKENNSEFFSERDFNLDLFTSESRFNYQPGTNWRLTFIYEYKLKQNSETQPAEFSEQHKGGIEIKFSNIQKGIITLRLNTIRISYNGQENSSLSYEMLEGLNKGINYTWGLNIQRALSGFLQLTLNYDGRKTENNKPIHTGGVELRAFF